VNVRSQPSMPQRPLNAGAGSCSRCDPGYSSRALVSECHKAIPGQVQTRSRRGVASMILTQVLM